CSVVALSYTLVYCFFFDGTPTTDLYTLSLHDALPISRGRWRPRAVPERPCAPWWRPPAQAAAIREVLEVKHVAGDAPLARPQGRDRKSTRLNSSHQIISYAVFCLKKKKKDHLKQQKTR